MPLCMLFVSPVPGTRHQKALEHGDPRPEQQEGGYERMGVPSYWVVDPQQPSITVFELTDGRYQLVTEVKGTDALEATTPFPVRVVPKELLGTLAG